MMRVFSVILIMMLLSTNAFASSIYISAEPVTDSAIFGGSMERIFYTIESIIPLIALLYFSVAFFCFIVCFIRTMIINKNIKKSDDNYNDELLLEKKKRKRSVKIAICHSVIAFLIFLISYICELYIDFPSQIPPSV